jgi:hypothetical protein
MSRDPSELHAAHKPRVGDPVTYKGEHVGTVTRVEGSLCWRTYPDGEVLPFIWCFKDGLNTLHDWPAKRRAAPVSDQRLALRAAAPIRATCDQDSTIGLPIFDKVDQPDMFG